MHLTHEDKACARLRSAVLAFELLPGERLSERALESMLGASRTPIRAALMRLENEGLVRKDERGWQVAPIDVAEVRAVMEYREALETAVVVRAIARAGAEDVAVLRAIAQASRDQDDEENGLRDGTDFHVALARLAGNPFLTDGVAGAMTRLFRTRWLGVRTPDSRARARAEHLAIADAVAARDADGATALVVSHLQGTAERLLDLLSAQRLGPRGRGLVVVESAPAAGGHAAG